MSGIYLPGMEMPQRDEVITIYPDGTAHRHHLGLRLNLSESKAIPVPDHGDLIDRDKLEKDLDKYIGGEESRSRFHHWVQVQDAVIPMDKGGEK